MKSENYTEPGSESGIPLLIRIQCPGDPAREYKIVSEQTLGRDHDCTIHLEDALISRFHLRFIPADGHWLVEDLGSANGTARNDVPIRAPTRLHTGDCIMLGQTRIEIVRCDSTTVELEDLLEQMRALVVRDGNSSDAVADRVRRVAGQIGGLERQKEIVEAALGYGPLEAMLADPAISEIMINGTSSLFVEQKGCLQQLQSPFRTEAEIRLIADRMARACGRKVDERSPLMDGRLSNGSRIHIALPPVALDGPCVTIRKFTAESLGFAELIQSGSIAPELPALFSDLVLTRKNCVIVGGTGTGKTTLLNLLSSMISEKERIVTIEDSAELQLRQSHVVRLESRPERAEGAPPIAIRELVRNALRMRPDRIIVGECRGGETLDMIQAMNTGHDGSMTTVHANSPRDALARLETMCLFAGVDIPLLALRSQITSAVQILIQVRRDAQGRRYVDQVMDLCPREEAPPVLKSLYERSTFKAGAQ